MQQLQLLERTITVNDLPRPERPWERLARLGPGALSVVELLAIILRGADGETNTMDLAMRLLACYGGLAGLAQASFSELVAERGMGTAKAARLRAALEIGRRLLKEEVEQRKNCIYSTKDAGVFLMAEIGYQEQENFCVLFLDARHRIIGFQTLYRGSLTRAQIRIGEVFREAIRRNCAAIIVAHNHPSGDTTPSPEDVAVTRQLVEAGRLLGIEVLDHLVIGNGWFSLREHGLGGYDQ